MDESLLLAIVVRPNAAPCLWCQHRARRGEVRHFEDHTLVLTLGNGRKMPVRPR